MHGRVPLQYVILGLIFACACSPVSSFPPPMPTADSAWSIRLTQSGGFIGVNTEIRVSSDGSMTSEDKRAGRIVSKPLSQATITELAHLLEKTSPSGDRRHPSACADCFNYSLEISSQRGAFRIQADDVTLGESGAEDLIRFLGSLRDEALATAS